MDQYHGRIKKDYYEHPSHIPYNNDGLSKQNSGFPKQISEKRVSEKKNNDKIEKEVIKIIKSEGIKTDKEKIQAIMNIDKIITSMQPSKPMELSAKDNLSSKKILSSITKKNIAPHLEEENFDSDDKMALSDKKIMNINFDEEPTVEDESAKKTISGTILSGIPINKNAQRLFTEVSEKIDPTKVNLIEDYGSQLGGSKKNRK